MSPFFFLQILTVLMPQIFSDHMVLQQGRNTPVWGEASPREQIVVSLLPEGGGGAVASVKVRADRQGVWRVDLPAGQADGGSYVLQVKGRKETLRFTDVVYGEVWLCSGQSNMAYEMRRSWQAPPRKGEDLATAELQQPANPDIRVFLSGSRPARRGEPAKDSWKIADGESLAPVSAAGYFFAKRVQKELGVPVGLISASVGGSAIAQWLPGGNLGSRLAEPLAPYALAGFLWYQGETDLAQRNTHYLEDYQQLAAFWREVFEVPDAPLYSVMLAPHTFSDRMHRQSKVTAEALPLFWQVQLRSEQTVPNSAAIYISDLVDNLEDIHPSYKWTVGERLAQLALVRHYGRTQLGEWSGPRAESLRSEADPDGAGQRLVVRFSHCAEGLSGRSNSVEPRSTARLKWFEIAGADGIWHEALADIVGKDEVAVYNPDVPAPKAVRFAWRETAQPNLYNSAGLPAYPFQLSK
ncbi:MAG: sialate O-acetylesterase [Bacteroidales bacterium]|nr:sialate O-acetylesterase [Bacteroidales bacterium]